MDTFLYMAGGLAVLSTVLVIASTSAVPALLYFIVSLLSNALIFYLFGAPFAAVLEVIIYAGAIMVLFIFVMMMLNLGSEAKRQERGWLQPRGWIGPVLLAAVLLGEIFFVLYRQDLPGGVAGVVGAKQVGMALFGPYFIAVELASLLLLAGLVGACHLAGKASEGEEKGEKRP